MDLALHEDETQIAAMAAELLAHEAPLERWAAPEADPGAEEARLRGLAAGLGWIGFGAPEAVGGSAASPVEEAVLFREVGRWLGPLSLAAGAAAARIAASGDPALAERIVAGEAPVGLVSSRDAGTVWRLGAPTGALALELGPGGVRLVALAELAPAVCLDPTVPAQTAPRSGVRAVAEGGPLELRRFQLFAAAQQLGLAEAALAASVDYAKLREQFGRPIGAFQAVRHRCVDMLVRCERARAQLWFAAVTLRDGAADAAFQVQAALRACDVAAGANARDNIFLHGAIGVTAEFPAHLFLKRAMLWRQALPAAAVLDEIAFGLDLRPSSGKMPPFEKSSH